MDFISQLKELNVKFKLINETEAQKIMTTQYPYYKLLEYAPAFERYSMESRKGQFVNTDFAELYYLALIDSRLSQIMMNICLKTEMFLKAVFIRDISRFGDTEKVLDEYYSSDKEYLESTYTSEKFEILKEKYGVDGLASLNIFQLIDVIQFGTLERLMHFFYKSHATDIYDAVYAPFECLLASVRRIRNATAHNNSILGRLDVKEENRVDVVASFLGRKGIKNRMLQTNLSKAVISDLCNVMYLYCKYVPDDKAEMQEQFKGFDINYCRKYNDVYAKNYMLQSLYDFMSLVVQIFFNDFKSNC